MAAKTIALALGVALLGVTAAWSAGEDYGYTWMTGGEHGNGSLTYGSPETGEDYVFNLGCDSNEKATRMTVYVDIVGTKVGDPVAIDVAAGDAKLSVPGKISTDEMSGFLFAEAKGFRIKPVLSVLKGKGPIRVKTGGIVTTLPEAGRGQAVGEFAKACALD